MISVHGSSSAARRSMRANRSRQACRRVSSAESPMSKLIVLCSRSRIVVNTPCANRSSANELPHAPCILSVHQSGSHDGVHR